MERGCDLDWKVEADMGRRYGDEEKRNYIKRIWEEGMVKSGESVRS